MIRLVLLALGLGTLVGIVVVPGMAIGAGIMELFPGTDQKTAFGLGMGGWYCIAATAIVYRKWYRGTGGAGVAKSAAWAILTPPALSLAMSLPYLSKTIAFWRAGGASNPEAAAAAANAAGGAPATVGGGLGASLLSVVLVVFAAVALVKWIGRRKKAAPADAFALPSVPQVEAVETGTHGTASWASAAEFYGGSGLILGRGMEPGGQFIRLPAEGHVLTVAPTGTGKGVGVVIPNLLVHPGSAVVNDIKGENYAVTARQRRSEGHAVYGLDPFGVVSEAWQTKYGIPAADACYNPLDLVDHTGLDALDDAKMIAEMLVVSEADSKSDGGEFWDREAKALLAGLILHVCASEVGTRRSLPRVRELLTLPAPEWELVLKHMAESTACDGVVARTANNLLGADQRTKNNIITSAKTHTHFLDSPRMRRILSSSSFDILDLKRDRVTLYLILPPTRIDSYKPWKRLMIGCSLLATTRVPGKPAGGHRILIIPDEFANMGKMANIQRDYTLLRGYGVTFWLLVQDFSQLERLYGDSWKSFVSNAAVLQAFGTADNYTAEYLSERMGEATILTRGSNAGDSHKLTGLVATKQRGENTSEKGRRLMFASEILAMDPARGEQLLFFTGKRPLMARRLRYFAEPEFAGRFDPNPLHEEEGQEATRIQVFSIPALPEFPELPELPDFDDTAAPVA